MVAIKTINLTKKYKDLTAVDNLNLEIKKGELFSLLGTNGAGKTTTIKIISTLTTPTSGDVFILGKNINKDITEIKKIISVSPQETAVAINLSVKENLEMICGIYGFSKAKQISKINEIITQFELDNVINKKVGKLSGGYMRRVSIAMALISEPLILFLDEPTLGLDIIARNTLWNIIKSLKNKVTIILTTHYMEEAEILSDRIGIMNNGKLEIVGTPNFILEKTNTKKISEAFMKVVEKEYI